jgi:hypothetical protein
LQPNEIQTVTLFDLDESAFAFAFAFYDDIGVMHGWIGSSNIPQNRRFRLVRAVATLDSNKR